MILYHYSVDSYTGGGKLINDYKNGYGFAEPFILAMRRGMDTFLAVYYAAMYMGREMVALKMRKYENYRKDAVEGIFEYVRETEFPFRVSRLRCVYYCRTKEEALAYMAEDCFADGLFTKDRVKLLRAEVEDGRVAEYDQTWFNRAEEAIGRDDFDEVLDCAFRYYSPERSEEPLIEIVSDGENRVLEEVEY